MMLSITLADMHYRDQRALDHIRDRAGDGGCAQISHSAIAEAIGCHRNTALAIVRRLERAQLIEVDRHAKRGGYLYIPKAVNAP
ncbi:MAG: hypothetical protein KJ065_26825 [Anaerolineae bacterium]|nr:hypothetical protein [Anaerolineae bacterium]